MGERARHTGRNLNEIEIEIQIQFQTESEFNIMNQPIATLLAAITDTAMAGDPAELNRIAKDYAYYKADPNTQQLQAHLDSDVEMFDEMPVDLAWAKTIERAKRRKMPRSVDMMSQFKAQVHAQKYAKAVGLEH